jgi:hypothetical protein
MPLQGEKNSGQLAKGVCFKRIIPHNYMMKNLVIAKILYKF